MDHSLSMLMLSAACFAAPVARSQAAPPATAPAAAPVLKHGGGLRFTWGLPAAEKAGGLRSLETDIEGKGSGVALARAGEGKRGEVIPANGPSPKDCVDQ